MSPSERLRDRVCLVTGATSGHGFALATGLAGQGARLILHGRDRERCLRAAREIRERTGGPEPELLLCDLSSRAEIDRAVAEYLDSGRPLHLLVNNAGAVFLRRQRSIDGVEMTMAVNYLAMFQLTLGLLPRILESAPGRIVNVASDAHMIGCLDPDDLQGDRRRYSMMEAYGRSKLAIIYFTRELARRLIGTGVTVNAVDPGPVESRIGQNNPGLAADALVWVMKLFFPSAERASRTALWLAGSPEAEGINGTYYRFMAAKRPKLAPSDIEVGRRLWEVSADLTGADWV